MIFVYNQWQSFCKRLNEAGIYSICARDVNKETKKYLVLKHDVETNVSHAYEIAKIEKKFGHRGSYYVQAYLLDDMDNIRMLTEMQMWGHEISYHYDVMDSCKGDIYKALEQFEENKRKFERNDFILETLCQHGNPVVTRCGYTSNRDFFRSGIVRERYPHLSDIMVNFKLMKQTEYVYFSDSGRKFKMIFDPINNDIIDSEDKNIVYQNLNELFKGMDFEGNNIISIHPHRWEKSSVKYIIKLTAFRTVKFVAKILIKFPLFKKIMSRYYYLAKKI